MNQPDTSLAAPASVTAPPQVSHTSDRPSQPLHTHMKSTLASTPDDARYWLLAIPARYTLRGMIDALFGTHAPNRFSKAMDRLTDLTLGQGSHEPEIRRLTKNVAYDYALGVGSVALTTTYTNLVYKDILNMFRETVGMELDMNPEKVSYWDLKRSHNTIVSNTLSNFTRRTAERYASDALFFLRPIKALRWLPMGDLALGIKSALIGIETWNHKPTVFEGLLSFVNNKINPNNGLGQPITVGELFDLYQYYAQTSAPDRAFTGVIEHSKGEGARWAGNQIIFQRMTELLNKTYAYKHQSIIDPATGHSVLQADFALPKFIYLLGNNLIDTSAPERTLVTIEIANSHGIDAVKQMQKMLHEGLPLADIVKQYHVTLPSTQLTPPTPADGEKNAVVSNPINQIDQVPDAAPAPVSPNALAPLTHIAANSVHHSTPLAPAPLAELPLT